MSAVRFESFTEARSHFKDLLDAAERGQVAVVRRDDTTAAVVDGKRLQALLARSFPSNAQVIAENDGWSIFIPGLPIGADGATFDGAVDDVIAALREYAEDWQARLLPAPNHRDRWALVLLICLSTDAQLREWLVGPTQ